jgi:ankyrin repeat protein
MLLEKGASVKVVTANNKTPLHLALEKEHGQIANLLTEKTPKHYLSTRRKNVKTAEILIEELTFLDDFENNKVFRLYLAAYNENVKRVKLLIEEGEIVDAFTNIRGTSLHIAAFKRNVDIAEILIHQGASVNALAMKDLTPLPRPAVL